MLGPARLAVHAFRLVSAKPKPFPSSSIICNYYDTTDRRHRQALTVRISIHNVGVLESSSQGPPAVTLGTIEGFLEALSQSVFNFILLQGTTWKSWAVGGLVMGLGWKQRPTRCGKRADGTVT